MVTIRVLVDPADIDRVATLRELPIRAPDGTLVKLSQVADIVEEPGQLELRREDLRQDVAVTARLEGRDLGSAMQEIQAKLSQDPTHRARHDRVRRALPAAAGVVPQPRGRAADGDLSRVHGAADRVPFVLRSRWRSSFGAVLALFGTVLALWVTGTSLNVVSFLGAIIGVGIVAKNGILMLDFVEHLRAEGASLEDALVRSGHRRLRPVLMTSLAAAFGMLPLAWGIGAGSDMLRPLAIAVIGALCISVLLSLVATPSIYYVLVRRLAR